MLQRETTYGPPGSLSKLSEIEAALVRLANGTFGRCERCRGPVPAARLTRTPQARYCADCDH